MAYVFVRCHDARSAVVLASRADSMPEVLRRLMAGRRRQPALLLLACVVAAVAHTGAQAQDVTLWVTLGAGFVVVDPWSRRVTKRVELGTLPDGVPAPYLDTWTHALELVKNDEELWVSDCINDLVRIVRTSDLTEIA